MVLDVEPVANIVAASVDRDRLPVQRLQYGERDQLLREMAGSVIVRAIADHGREPKGLAPGTHHVVGRRLRRRVRRIWLIARGFGELAGRAQRAENLVGRNMVETEASGAF